MLQPRNFLENLNLQNRTYINHILPGCATATGILAILLLLRKVMVYELQWSTLYIKTIHLLKNRQEKAACMESSMMEQIRVLIVDDEAVIRDGLKRILSTERFMVETCASGFRAIELLNEQEFDLIITDLKMPGMNGIEVLKAVATLQPGVPVIMITGYATVETAVEAMKNGAVDYITKPFAPAQFLEKVEHALEQRIVPMDEVYLKKEIASHHGFHHFVGESKEMLKVYRRIMQVAATNSTVLITGESGTGKELVARAIHEKGPRHNQPFVAVDCSSLAETLLESELFGHVKGSFTGAMQNKVGLFKVADGGTLFLDEVSNISLSTQAKLLRTLQERQITPIGGTQPQPINIHLVAATNRNLKTMVAEGTFREDLFFRLNIIPIELPPLRERKGDIPLLISYFLKNSPPKSARRSGLCHPMPWLFGRIWLSRQCAGA